MRSPRRTTERRPTRTATGMATSSSQDPTAPGPNPDAQVMVRRCGLMSTPGASCRRTYRRQASSGPGEHDFQGTGFASAGEDVVCLLELVEVELVCHEL